jgi:protein-disulfide isomerase
METSDTDGTSDHGSSAGRDQAAYASRPLTAAEAPAFSASSRNFDLNGEARTARTKQNSPIIMALGPDHALVTITEYASMTCPHCAAFNAKHVSENQVGITDCGQNWLPFF